MIRTSIAAALVYALGLPFFDGYRPAVLDEPLHTFAAQINLAAQYSFRVVPSIDVARSNSTLQAMPSARARSCAGPTIDPRADRA